MRNNNNNNNNSGKFHTRFPFRLHVMLEEACQDGNEELIAWLPCGSKFRIHAPADFTTVILPKYFRHSKYKSFLRQLSMYKFQRINFGPSKGCYFHPHFLRNRVDLAELINRDRIEPISVGSKLSLCAASAQERSMDLDYFGIDKPLQGQPLLEAKPLPVQKQDFHALEERLPVQDQDFHALWGNMPADSPIQAIPPCSPLPDDIANEIIKTFCREPPTQQKKEEEELDLASLLSFAVDKDDCACNNNDPLPLDNFSTCGVFESTTCVQRSARCA